MALPASLRPNAPTIPAAVSCWAARADRSNSWSNAWPTPEWKRACAPHRVQPGRGSRSGTEREHRRCLSASTGNTLSPVEARPASPTRREPPAARPLKRLEHTQRVRDGATAQLSAHGRGSQIALVFGTTGLASLLASLPIHVVLGLTFCGLRSRSYLPDAPCPAHGGSCRPVAADQDGSCAAPTRRRRLPGRRRRKARRLASRRRAKIGDTLPATSPSSWAGWAASWTHQAPSAKPGSSTIDPPIVRRMLPVGSSRLPAAEPRARHRPWV